MDVCTHFADTGGNSNPFQCQLAHVDTSEDCSDSYSYPDTYRKKEPYEFESVDGWTLGSDLP
jgi:hypothetical protein